MNSRTAGALSTCGGFAAVLIWSGTICLSRSLMEQLGMFTAASLVFLLSGVISILGVWGISRLTARGLPRLSSRYLVMCGIPFVLYMVCLYTAVGRAADRRQVIEVGLINYLWPTLALVFSVPILKYRARWWLLLIGVVTACGGIYMASNAVAEGQLGLRSFASNIVANPAAYLTALGAAILWALYSNLARRFATQSHPLGVPLFFLASGIALGAIRLFVHEATNWSGRSCVELALIVLFSCIAAYTLWDRAMRRGNMVLVASFAYFTPLFSTLLSGLYLGVKLPAGIWIACALVMAGAWLSRCAVDAEGT